MIYVYNEKENPVWSVNDKNGYFYQIEGPGVSIDLSKTGLGGRELSDLIKINALNMCIRQYDLPLDRPAVIPMNTALNDKTMIVFDRKKLTPFIHSVGDRARHNNDLFLCSFDMTNHAVYSVTAYNGNIYSYKYDHENDTLAVIFSLKGGIDERTGKEVVPSLRIVGSTDAGAYYRKRIIADKKDPSKFVMNYNVWDTEDDIPTNSKGMLIIDTTDRRSNDLKTLHMKVYRPKRPCANIVNLQQGDGCKNIIEKRFHINLENVKIYSLDENKGGIKGLISFTRKHKIDTVTVFDNVDTKSDIKELRDKYLNKMNFKQFKTVQLMGTDGSIVYLK